MVIKSAVSQIWLTKSLQLTASIVRDVMGLKRDRKQIMGSLQIKPTQHISVVHSSHFRRSLPGRAQGRKHATPSRGWRETFVRWIHSIATSTSQGCGIKLVNFYPQFTVFKNLVFWTTSPGTSFWRTVPYCTWVAFCSLPCLAKISLTWPFPLASAFTLKTPYW